MTALETDLAILASAVVVLGGLVALVRALLRIRDVLRDNIRATETNTEALGELSTKMDGRISALEAWRVRVEGERRRWLR